jgi:hypothetical protein
MVGRDLSYMACLDCGLSLHQKSRLLGTLTTLTCCTHQLCIIQLSCDLLDEIRAMRLGNFVMCAGDCQQGNCREGG